MLLNTNSDVSFITIKELVVLCNTLSELLLNKIEDFSMDFSQVTIVV